jgi:hypothetical protein
LIKRKDKEMAIKQTKKIVGYMFWLWVALFSISFAHIIFCGIKGESNLAIFWLPQGWQPAGFPALFWLVCLFGAGFITAIVYAVLDVKVMNQRILNEGRRR